MPLYRIEKNPKLARKQGAFSVVAATALILKRGPDLKRVINVLDRKRFSVVESHTRRLRHQSIRPMNP